MKELVSIQNELKCPKARKNKFGDYNYRNCDDIYEAVKPLLLKHNCTLVVADDIRIMADRVYVVSTTTFTNSGGQSVYCTGFAREQFTKKGMDEAQITGAASSYARKYALGGLLLLDDSDDQDGGKTENAPDKISADQLITIRDLFKISKRYTEDMFVKEAKIATLEDLNADRYDGAFRHIQAKVAKEAA